MCTEGSYRKSESGQAAVLMLLVLSALLLGAVGFAVDLGNLWFHRQAAQSASDAACQAGAMDMLVTSGGMQLQSMGFTPGTGSNCAASPAATMCAYAKFNGYGGAGPGNNLNSAWNTVSWSFPSAVSGVTAPPASQTAAPYMQVTVTENVPTWFLPVFTGSGYQQVSSSCTCGLAQVKEAAPMIVLHPSMSGSFYYSGGGKLTIVGGPQRSLQVNSTSTTAISWISSGIINTSAGGPNYTGSDVGVVGGPAAGSGASTTGFNGGTTGAWRSGGLPVPDPYAALAVPASIKSLTPITGTAGTWVDYHQDGCPDHSGTHYPTTDECIEFGPGYYPNGITSLDGYSTAIFLPGIYYLNGSLVAKSSESLRNATPCSPTCGPVSSQAGLTSHQTDGVMFYFLSGSFSVSGCSGCVNSSIDNVSSTAITCDGNPPSALLGMPSTLPGNVLWAQCTANGTYWDGGGDTSDSAGNPGSRGILFFQDHGDLNQPTFSGSGSLSFAGSIYFHSSSYSDLLNISGGSSSGTFIVGNIVTDQVKLTGSGAINLALSPAPSVYMLKAATFR